MSLADLPDGWKRESLGAIVDFQKGKVVESIVNESNHTMPVLNAAILDAGVPNEFSIDGLGIIANTTDVLMLWDGERSGHVAKGQDGIVSSTMMRIRPKKRINSSYLYYFLKFHYPWIKARRTGTGVPHVPKDLKHIMFIDFPEEVSEQEKIAQVLSNADTVIASTRRVILKISQVKKGLINDLLSRGLDIEGNINEGSPVDWQRVRFSEIGRIISGGTPSRKVAEYWGGEIPWFTPQEITSDDVQIVSKSKENITQSGYNSSSAQLIPPGSVLITTRASIGFVAMNDVEVTTNQGFQSLVVNDNNSAEFFQYFIPWVRTKIIRFSQGSTFNEISKRTLSNLEFLIPYKDEQIRIASAISKIERRLNEEKLLLNKWTCIYDGLLSDLMTGAVTPYNEVTS